MLPRQQYFFQSQPKFAREGAALLGLICYISVILLIIPGYLAIFFFRLCAIVPFEGCQLWYGTRPLWIQCWGRWWPHLTIRRLHQKPSNMFCSFFNLFFDPARSDMSDMDAIFWIIQIWARLFALRQEWGLVLPDLWGIGFLPRWNDGVPWRSCCDQKFAKVATCHHCHIASCILYYIVNYNHCSILYDIYIYN